MAVQDMTPLFAFANFLNLITAQAFRENPREAWMSEGWELAYRENFEHTTESQIKDFYTMFDRDDPEDWKF